MNINEIKEALEAATKGPWDFGVFEDSRHVIYDNTYFSRHIAEIVKGGVESEQREEDNARLIANAPQWISSLVTQVEELQKALEWYADEQNYKDVYQPEGFHKFINQAESDNGQRARIALQSIQGGDNT